MTISSPFSTWKRAPSSGFHVLMGGPLLLRSFSLLSNEVSLWIFSIGLFFFPFGLKFNHAMSGGESGKSGLVGSAQPLESVGVSLSPSLGSRSS